MAYLIELYAGAFPVWLAPVQAVLISVSDRHLDYARRVSSQLTNDGFRVEVDESDKWLKAKIREAQLQKIPYILVVGDKEIEKGTVAVRLRTGEDLGEKPISEFKEAFAYNCETKIFIFGRLVRFLYVYWVQYPQRAVKPILCNLFSLKRDLKS